MPPPITPADVPSEELKLLEQARLGDSDAFATLATRYERKIYRIAKNIVQSDEDAEDVVQDAFARVYSRLSEFEGASAFYTWLYRIVVNLSIDLIRKRRRERRVDVESEQARDAVRDHAELWPRFDGSHPGEAAERRQLADRLSKAFADLPEIHQAVLLLRELEGMSYEEIAHTLSIKKGTVMSRLFHARRGLQQKLTLQADVASKAAPEGSR